nr:hypothetical protein [Tanacetum cinerariifolium]
MDEALVPTAQRLKIGRSNFQLLSDIKSKELTLQLVYDVLRRCPFFNAFLFIADVSEIYMQEFWATATVHYHSIRFKMDTKKHIINLESFRDILHIRPRVPGQPFIEPSFEEEILAFIRFLGHSVAIRTLTDSSGYDSLRLSQAQILWGLYHKRNIDYAYLMWEDFVYQLEQKNQKKSNEMYYPRFTKAIIHHFMSKDPLIPRRNKQQSNALLRFEVLSEEYANLYYAHESCKEMELCCKECKKEMAKLRTEYENNVSAYNQLLNDYNGVINTENGLSKRVEELEVEKKELEYIN